MKQPPFCTTFFNTAKIALAVCKKYPVRHNEKEKITGNESIVFFLFHPSGLIPLQLFFFTAAADEAYKK